MGKNIYQGQLVGPFAAGEELFDRVKEDSISEPKFIKHIGIETDVDKPTFVYINGDEREIGGIRGIYEIGNTEVTSVKFKEDKDKNTIVDYIIEIETNI